MLIHPTVERLRALGLAAMANALVELQNAPDAAELTREDWLGLLVDREATSRENKRSARRVRDARAAPVCRRRGCRLPRPSQPRSGSVPEARQLRVGPRSSPSGRRRANRAGDMMRYLAILLERQILLSRVE